MSGIAGSPAYVAPEVLSGSYREKVDIWSAGILLHALLIGSLPFQGKSLETVFDAIKNNKLDFHSGPWQSVSKLARDLVEKMLTRDVLARISADEVLGKFFRNSVPFETYSRPWKPLGMFRQGFPSFVSCVDRTGISFTKSLHFRR